MKRECNDSDACAKFEIENILLHIWNQEISTPSVYTIYTGWIRSILLVECMVGFIHDTVCEENVNEYRNFKGDFGLYR